MLRFTAYRHPEHDEFLRTAFREAFPGYLPQEMDRCIALLRAGMLRCTLPCREELPVGFIIYKEYPAFFYCEYIAMAAAHRGRRYSTLLLQHVMEQKDKQWVFEVETTHQYNLRAPRIKLFKDCGCTEDRFRYDMPRVEQIHPGTRYNLWSRYPMNEEEFREVYDTLRSDPDF